jgi:ribosome-binding protein aMBF1 (putative translation factor)
MNHLKSVINRNHTHNAEGTSKFHQLDGDEPHAPRTIDYNHKVKIQQGRALKKMSQKDLAMKINVTVNTINSYELGTAIPSKSILRKIQNILDIKL